MKIHFIVVCFVLAALAYGRPILAESSPKVHVGSGNQKNARNQAARTNDTNAAKAKKLNAQQKDCASTGDDNTVDCQNLKINKAVADANLRVANWTAILAFVGIVQAVGLLATLVATFKAASAAQKSADVAAESAVTYERTSALLERAYIEITQVDLPGPMELPRFPRIVVHLKNQGRTPAYIFEGFTRSGIFEEIPKQPNSEEPTTFGQFRIGASSSTSQDARSDSAAEVTLENLHQIKSGSRHLLVWGS